MSSDDPSSSGPGAREPDLVDPVLSELRRLRPEVDVVVLPAEATTESATEAGTAPGPRPREVDLAGARGVARHVHVVLDGLLAGLVARGTYDAADEPDAATRIWTGRSDSSAGCTYAASVGLRAPDEEAARSVVEQVGDLLLAHGHDARPVRGRRVRLLSSDGRCVVDAEARGGHVRLEVRSLPVLLGRDDLVRLRQEAHASLAPGERE